MICLEDTWFVNSAIVTTFLAPKEGTFLLVVTPTTYLGTPFLPFFF